MIAALADAADVEVLSYDSGHFESYPALAAAIEPALLRHADVTLVAESFAGPLGVLLAHRHPARVRGLVMAATFVHAPLHLSRAGARLLDALPAFAPPVFALERLLADRGLPLPLRRYRPGEPPLADQVVENLAPALDSALVAHLASSVSTVRPRRNQ